MASLIGGGIGQIPTNGMLGEMAFQNSTGITVQQIQSPIGIVSTYDSNTFIGATVTTQDYTNLTLQPIEGNVVIGAGLTLATSSTKGFLCIPTCSGAPTGIVSAAPLGTVPIIFDTTNNRLYVRTPSGTWRYSITT
jgi:hypothetical protein